MFSTELNWVQHQVQNGKCIRCHREIPYPGIMYSKEWAFSNVTPMKYTLCEPQI